MARLIFLAALLVAVYVWWRPAQARTLYARVSPFLPLALAFLYLAVPVDLIPDAGLVGVIDDLIVLVTAAFWGFRQSRGQQRSAAGGARAAAGHGASSSDPYEVLGLRPGATPEEVTRAYRERMKLYHPDRVSGLGEDLQRVANDKTIEIQRAYEALRTRKSKGA